MNNFSEIPCEDLSAPVEGRVVFHKATGKTRVVLLTDMDPTTAAITFYCAGFQCDAEECESNWPVVAPIVGRTVRHLPTSSKGVVFTVEMDPDSAVITLLGRGFEWLATECEYLDLLAAGMKE